MVSRLAIGTAALALSAMATAAWAQEAADVPVPTTTQEAGGSGVKLTLGAGLGMAPDYEGSDHYVAVPLWNIRAQNLYGPTTYAQLLGPILRSNLLPSDHWRLGLAGRYISKRGSVDDNQVDDMRNVDPSVMLGPMVGYDFIAEPGRLLGIEGEFIQDVANGNGGLGTVRLHGAYALSPSLVLSGQVSSSYATSDYMDAYFRVGPGDARRSGLKQYSADAGLEDVGFALAADYRFAGNWSLTGIGAYNRLLNDAADSPVTKQGSENQWFTGLMLNYRF